MDFVHRLFSFGSAQPSLPATLSATSSSSQFSQEPPPPQLPQVASSSESSHPTNALPSLQSSHPPNSSVRPSASVASPSPAVPSNPGKSQRKPLVPNRCFYEAFQATVFAQKVPELLPTSRWEAFLAWQMRTVQKDLSVGVWKGEINEFYRYLHRNGTRIDMKEIRPNRLKTGVPNAERFEDVARELDPGWYLVLAGGGGREHCFAVGAFGPYIMPAVIQRYKEDESPPCQIEPLVNLRWIQHVRSIRLVTIMPKTRVFKPSKRRRDD